MAKMKTGIWLNKKPIFNEECTFITGIKYQKNREPVEWEYSVWQIKKLDGETEEGQPAWYWGLLTGDGDEWGDIDDLRADTYFIIPSIKSIGSKRLKK